ncbi:hypothetical protein ACP26L_23720 [Paenibacillus sp. S-38]|uniref:FixH family protein n=1 Tax=Paenibacillus sp. S-38 TaxID=3416710 RepID=UPI003CF04975
MKEKWHRRILLLWAGAGAAALLWGIARLLSGEEAEEVFQPRKAFAAGNYTVEVALSEGRARVLQENPLAVSVKDAAGSPVAGAEVLVAISMPVMFCGTSRSELSETAPGLYTGSGIPLMAGRQSAGVTVRLPGGEALQVSFPFAAER